ncbi:hypothetical protein Taro_039021 [Colocasia esculenta]|uniref:NAC domain-containing protein n=1 Tax=Colocasia esculenta TaxID=4460 RepID=A0A843W9K5_COLES|nr:hypothetical protein [Colocasia esculenta]
MGSRLPGFRFYPTEQELVYFYLRNKLENRRPEIDRIIPVVDVYEYDPPQLPTLSGEASPVQQDHGEWFFFCPRQEKEAHGGRPKRTTPSGFWKATGSPAQVIDNNRVIGRKKTMVFYEGKAPTGRKTSWKMNEYKAYDEPSSSGETMKLRSEFSVCRLHRNSGCQRSFDRRPTVAAAPGANAVDMEWVAAAFGRPSYHGSNPPAAPTAEAGPSDRGSLPPAGQEEPAPEEAAEADQMMLDVLDWDFLFGCDEN